jgi:hypothetical protein
MRTLKIVLSITVFFFFSALIYGQPEQGRILMGGETKLNFTSIKKKSGSMGEIKITSFELSPQLGVFASKSLALGIDMQISVASEDGSKTTSLAFAPFIRLYAGAGNIKPFLQGEIGFGKLSEGDMNYTSKSDLFLYEIDGGLGIFLSRSVSFDLRLGYAYLSQKHKDYDMAKDTSSGIGFGIGLFILL